MSLPRSIYSTWKTKDNLKGNKLVCVDSIKKHNPGFKHAIWDDEDCREFVKDYYPEYYSFYQQLEIPVQKADLWRYLVIYHYGGWYCDMDIYAFRGFDTISLPNKKEDLMVVELEYPAPLKIAQTPRSPQYAQYWFGATPRHPVLKKIIETVVENIENIENIEEFQRDGIKNSDDITLHLTGPVPFTDVIAKHIKKKKEDVLILKGNVFDTLSQPLYSVSNLFSEKKNIPVVHLCDGSWREHKLNPHLIVAVILIVVFFVIISLFIDRE